VEASDPLKPGSGREATDRSRLDDEDALHAGLPMTGDRALARVAAGLVSAESARRRLACLGTDVAVELVDGDVVQ
jgi:hypothetical protein